MSIDAGQAIFNQVDANRDGSIDINEFRQWAGGAGGAGIGGSSGYQSSSFDSAGFGAGLGGSASYESSTSYGSGGYDAGISSGFIDGGSASYDSASYGSGGYGGGIFSSSYGVDSGAFNQSYDVSSSALSNVQTYATDSQGLYQDPNPQIIHRPAAISTQTYTQNIHVRYLQPPPVPPPGPLIIREVRPPQPPAPPPLRVRQQAPPRPRPGPIVLREHPPSPPAPIAPQTVVRRLPGIPVPPRSVVVERLPPLPPRPRDIIVDKWLPYGARGQRRTIVQRAGAAHHYSAPRNVIINYEAPSARIVRQVHKHGVIVTDPRAYVQQYAGQLVDSSTLSQKASSIGISEYLQVPVGSSSYNVGYGASSYGQDLGDFCSSYESSGGYGFDGGADWAGSSGGFGYDGGLGGGSYESSSWSSSGGGGWGGDIGFGSSGFY